MDDLLSEDGAEVDEEFELEMGGRYAFNSML